MRSDSGNMSDAVETLENESTTVNQETVPVPTACTQSPLKRLASTSLAARSSPVKKLRLEIAPPIESQSAAGKRKFIYGNYNRYYGYRNPNVNEDVRIVAFRAHPTLFADKHILDIGCNDGAVTMAVAKEFRPKNITGIDIDKDLISVARKHVAAVKRKTTENNNGNKNTDAFPNNIAFRTCNYVLDNECLLDVEQSQFDTILCLSVVKWIQLNFGDAGLKLAFKRMFRQLRPGGHLILETQNWKSYKRRKNLTPQINEHFKQIKLLPNAFQEYLLSADVGFEECTQVELPAAHNVKGFQRPIQIYRKPNETNAVQSACFMRNEH